MGHISCIHSGVQKWPIHCVKKKHADQSMLG